MSFLLHLFRVQFSLGVSIRSPTHLCGFMLISEGPLMALFPFMTSHFHSHRHLSHDLPAERANEVLAAEEQDERVCARMLNLGRINMG